MTTSCVQNHKPLTFQLGYFLKGIILLLSVSSKCSLACGSWFGYHWHGSQEDGEGGISSAEIPEKHNVSGVKNHFDRNSKVAWSGWTPSEDVKKDWQDWLTNWENQNNDTDYMKPSDKAKFQEERAGTGFPADWQDLGEGIGGVAPPPWSYSPKYIGKPLACNMPPKRGNCDQKLDRWGFNPYTDKCAQFQFSGCNGNANNFLTQLDCEKLCMAPPTTGCDNGEKIYPEDLG